LAEVREIALDKDESTGDIDGGTSDIQRG